MDLSVDSRRISTFNMVIEGFISKYIQYDRIAQEILEVLDFVGAKKEDVEKVKTMRTTLREIIMGLENSKIPLSPFDNLILDDHFVETNQCVQKKMDECIGQFSQVVEVASRYFDSDIYLIPDRAQRILRLQGAPYIPERIIYTPQLERAIMN